MLDYLPPLMPDDKPRYLMGVGKPEDLVEGVRRGVDMFDCVMPTRNARNGHLFTAEGTVKIRNASIATTPVRSRKAATATPASTSRAAICTTWIGAAKCSVRMLNTIHNLRYYQRLMAGLRGAIEAGTLADFVKMFYARRGLPVPDAPQ